MGSVSAFTSSGAEMRMWSTVWRLVAKLAPIVCYFLVFLLLISSFFEINLTVDALMSETREFLYGKVLRIVVLHVSIDLENDLLYLPMVLKWIIHRHLSFCL